jgi:zinc protease
MPSLRVRRFAASLPVVVALGAVTLIGAAALAGALVGGCMLFGRHVDSSWGPLQSAATAAALIPSSEAAVNLPRFSVREQLLPSGLRLGVEAGSTPGMVTVVTVVGSGSSADPPGREGLAHLVEHLVYHAHGAGGRPQSERLTRAGASYNADTSLESTRFYEIAPAGAQAALLDLAGERLQRPLAGVDEADLERERAIVENELNQRNEIGVYGSVMSWMQRALFPPGHAYARPVGGSVASVRRLTLADARSFAATHYRPENATLLVTGETGGRSLLATVAAGLPEALRARTGAAPRRAPALAAGAGGRPAPTDAAETPPDTMQAAVALPEIWLAYDLGGGGGSEAAVSRILTARAAQAMVRERLLPEPEVLAVEFHVIELQQSTLLACQIVLEHVRRRVELARKAENLIWALWSDTGPPAAVEWEGWRQGTVGDLRQAALADAVLGAEPSLERALARALSFHATGAIDAYDRTLGAIAVARPDDVSGRAFSWLAPERARTLFLEPATEAQRPAPGPIGVPSAENLPPEQSPFRGADLGAPPRAPPPAGLREATTTVLANGLTVVLVRRPQFPSVTALLGFHGGAAALPAGVLALVRAVEPRRATNPPATAATWRLEKADGPGYTADLVHTDRGHLSNALYMLADRLQAVAETDWARLLTRAQRHGSGHTPPPEEPRQLASMKLSAALYGAHPHARRVRAADILALDPDVVPAWLPRLYNPGNAVLIIAGDIDTDAAARLADGWFGAWRGAAGTGRLGVPDVAPPEGGGGRESVLITPRPVATQVELTFACRLAAPKTPRERAAQQMVAGLLGGVLTEKVREQAGAAYSIDSAAAALPGGGAHLEVAMSVDSRRLRDALRVLRGQVAALAAGRIDQGAISQARWSLTRGAAMRFQTSTELAETLFQRLTLGTGPAAVAAEPDEILRVDDRDLARAFAPCAARPILSLVGDDALVRAAL